jgi:hypothetical protein
VDTALNTAVAVIDRIKDTATAHRRAMVVGVLGRDSGYLAVMSAIAGGADATIVPEFETEPQELLDLLNESYEKGKPRFTVVVAEGASPTAEEFCEFVNEAGGGYQADLTTLGHIQSGGTPRPSTASSQPAWAPPPWRPSPTTPTARWSPSPATASNASPSKRSPDRSARSTRTCTAWPGSSPPCRSDSRRLSAFWRGFANARRIGRRCDGGRETRRGGPGLGLALEAIQTQKRGGKLAGDVIRDVVAGYTEGSVPDIQASALLMAVFIGG